MRLRASVVALALLMGCRVGAGMPPSPAASPDVSLRTPTTEEIRTAVARLRSDPNLGTQRRVRSLHWVNAAAAPPPAAPRWIVGLFEFAGQAASLVVWVAGAIAAAIGVVWLYRLLTARRLRPSAVRAATASHIGEWDIRPISLPADIGAAALALLQAGRSRDALSLLYRGALSKAVHSLGVVIGESFTEGEALHAVARAEPLRAAYFGELVRLWRLTVYAGIAADTDAVAALCARFTPALAGPV